MSGECRNEKDQNWVKKREALESGPRSEGRYPQTTGHHGSEHPRKTGQRSHPSYCVSVGPTSRLLITQEKVTCL